MRAPDREIAVLAIAAILLVSACSRRHGAEEMPVPRLGGEIVTLKVAYVANPRFPAMNGAQLSSMLAVARQGVKDHFGTTVQFLGPEEQRLDVLFDRLPLGELSGLNARIYDFKTGTGNRSLLDRKYAEGLRAPGNDLYDMIAYAKPFLVVPVREESYEAFAEALTTTLLMRLEKLKSQKLPDGNELIDRSPNNEYVFWDAIGRLSFPYDVVITNQLIASAEYVGPSVHSAIRGGITNGITTRNPLGRYGTTVIVSTYPFIGKDEVTRELRGGETYSDAESAKLAGFVLVHEIGHQLFHFGHPYGKKSCVMNPTEMLHFRIWVERLAPKGCPIGSSPEMNPGFEKFLPSKP